MENNVGYKIKPLWGQYAVMSVRFILNYSESHWKAQFSSFPIETVSLGNSSPELTYRSSKKENLIETTFHRLVLVTSISGDNARYTQHSHSMKKHESNHFPCSYILQENDLSFLTPL